MRFLPKCLYNLMNQSYKDYEVVVVDAGSNDGGPEFIEQQYPQIRLFRRENIGLGEAINLGIRNSTGTVLVFDFNTDEYVEPNWLEQLVNELERHDYNVVVGHMRLINNTRLIDEAGVDLNLFGQAKKIGQLKSIDKFEVPGKQVVFVGCPALHRKIYERVGPIDEEYFIYGEDLDYCYRAGLFGYATRCAKNAVSYHHVRGTMGQNVRRLEFFLRRANIRFHLIHSGVIKVFLNLVYVCFFLSLSSFVLSILGVEKSRRYKDKFSGRTEAIFWNIRNIRRTIQKRRQYKKILLKQSNWL